MVTLEGATEPVFIHDIQRMMISDYGAANWTSVAVMVSQDPRPCWAGRGLYGLARHGIVPGPHRSLDVPAMAILGAANLPMHRDVISFLLQRFGYRFTQATLISALKRTRIPEEPNRTYWLSRTRATDILHRRIAPTRRETENILDALNERIVNIAREATREMT